MGDCKLEVHLDEPHRVYRTGETIHGTVRVITTDTCRCDGLTVAVSWKTHGKGNTAHGDLASDLLFVGEWPAYTDARYQFSLQIPTHAAAKQADVKLPGNTYHGEVTSLDYRVHAAADIPWAFDPKAEHPFVLQDPISPHLDVTWKEGALRPKATWGCFGCFFVMALLSAMTILLNTDYVPMMLAFTIVALVIALLTLPKLLAERKLGGVRLELERLSSRGYRDAYQRGVLKCGIRMKPHPDIDRVNALFKVEEVTVRGSGSNRKTFTAPIETVPITLAPGEGPGHYHGEFQLPLDGSAPLPYSVTDNRVRWSLTFNVVIDNTPDWKHSIPFEVMHPSSKS